MNKSPETYLSFGALCKKTMSDCLRQQQKIAILKGKALLDINRCFFRTSVVIWISRRLQ